MFEVVPFKAEHLAAIQLQSMQAHLSNWVTLEEGVGLEQSPGYTAFSDGKPIGAAGVLPLWMGRAMAWAFIAKSTPQDFLKGHRVVKKFLDGCHIRRIEMTVDCDFPAAHRWAKMLGFEMECERMKHYSPDGRDCALYARITP
jgi:hypothetical protein|tara:strand:- start:168 stop:596 length:429 start_codon:yes stop_codon:yes gene_type:complete